MARSILFRGKTLKRCVSGLVIIGLVYGAWGLRGQERESFDAKNEPLIREAMARGDYKVVDQITGIALSRGGQAPFWRVLRVQALSEMGRSEEAWEACEQLIQANPESLETWMTRHRLARSLGRVEAAQEALQKMNEVARKIPSAQRNANDLVLLGQAALVMGADPKKILPQFYEVAKKKDKSLASVYLAIGELALEKEDYERAGAEFQAGLKQHPEDPDLRFGLARAYQPGDRAKCLEVIDQVLARNPHHHGARCLQAELFIGSERYDEASATLDEVMAVNPGHPEAWAYRGVLAILVKNQSKEAAKAREEGLKLWPGNPQVDHIMGRCLSRSYRFQLGSEHQREALKKDPAFQAAKLQLARDLFRLGQEEEAWKLTKEVRDADGYNVQAHNLGLLEEEMKKFYTRSEPDFLLRMPRRDYDIYGDRALELLREAKPVLCAKYGLTLERPVLVEFFPSQADFAIRTFGNLGGQGILGACFGTVVTMNSPGSISARRSNWESTLWHEFCHVVTLSVTHNQMPRWLSEGISVYEEQMRDEACGMRMTEEFRERILGEKGITPLGKLSSAFIGAKSGEDLMFAYFESAQAVQYLIDKYGMEKFRGILADLAKGLRINEAISRNTAPLEKLEPAFDAHFKKLAQNLAPKADFAKLDTEGQNLHDPRVVAELLKAHPNSVDLLRQQCRNLLSQRQWTEAIKPASELIKIFPNDVEFGCGYDLAALAYHSLKQPAEEARVLAEWVKRSGDAADACHRLMELQRETKNWAELKASSQRSLAINPFLKQPYECLAAAADAENDHPGAIAALRRLLVLGPDDPVDVNYRLAQLLLDQDRAAAKRHLLDALADAPRFKEAYHLLLEMQEKTP